MSQGRDRNRLGRPLRRGGWRQGVWQGGSVVEADKAGLTGAPGIWPGLKLRPPAAPCTLLRSYYLLYVLYLLYLVYLLASARYPDHFRLE